MSPTSPILYAGRADERIVEGRAERSGETYYTVPGAALTATATLSMLGNDNLDLYAGWVARTPIVIDQLAFEVTAANASNTRVGFYSADRDWQPFGAPLADSGDISTGSTGVKTYTPSTPILVRPGRYLSVLNTAGSPSLRVYDWGSPMGGILAAMGTAVVGVVRASRSYAAFPTPGAAWTNTLITSVSGRHFVVYRLSQP